MADKLTPQQEMAVTRKTHCEMKKYVKKGVRRFRQDQGAG